MMRKLTCAWLSILAVALVWGCDDNPTHQEDQGGQDDILQETQEIDTDTAVETSYLEVVVPANGEPQKLFTKSDTTITVGYFTSDGQPIVGANLAFSIVESTENCHNAAPACIKLQALVAPTGDTGTATMKITSNEKAADARIRVSVESNSQITPVDVVVQSRDKDSYDLRVKFEYAGARPFTHVSPILFATENQADCAAVFTPPLRDPDLLPTAARQNPDVVRDTQTGKIPDSVFINLPTGKTFIAFGYALTASELVTVYGCTDRGAGTGDSITVTLVDVPMTVAGIYDLTSNYDMLSGIPRATNPQDPGDYEAGDWVDFVVNLFQDPGTTLYGLLGPYIEQIGGFDIPDGLDAVIGDMINSAIYNYAPESVTKWITIGGDVADFVTSLQLIGELRINGEPDLVTGMLPGLQDHSYNKISIRWRLPCVLNGTPVEQCSESRKTLAFAEIGRPDLELKGTWTGAVKKCENSNRQCLEIQRHPMTIPYGEIFLAVIEGWVLPQFFGSLVDSLESFIDRVLLEYIITWYNNANPTTPVPVGGGCTSVGQILGDLAADDGIVNDVVSSIGEYACTEGKNYLVDMIRDYAKNKLTLDTADNLQLATLGDCELRDADDNLQFDMIGDKLNDTTRCKWDVQFKWGDNAPTQIDGLFHGVRGGD